jgi:osmotically-inducible protein OsmY
MKHTSIRSIFFVLSLVAGFYLSSCKDKAKENSDTKTETRTDSASATPGTPEISSDAALEQGVKDATKDYPAVTASVSNGEVTLTGTIERDKLPTLLQSINGLNPKKVNNQLTIK